jgi:hypothetical protein
MEKFRSLKMKKFLALTFVSALLLLSLTLPANAQVVEKKTSPNKVFEVTYPPVAPTNSTVKVLVKNLSDKSYAVTYKLNGELIPVDAPSFSFLKPKDYRYYTFKTPNQTNTFLSTLTFTFFEVKTGKTEELTIPIYTPNPTWITQTLNQLNYLQQKTATLEKKVAWLEDLNQKLILSTTGFLAMFLAALIYAYHLKKQLKMK